MKLMGTFHDRVVPGLPELLFQLRYYLIGVIKVDDGGGDEIHYDCRVEDDDDEFHCFLRSNHCYLIYRYILMGFFLNLF